jgi:DNA mismatch repair protein MutS2
LLNTAENDLRHVEKKEKDLNRLIRENQQLKKEMQQVLDKEKHQQQVELLKEQNKITEEKLTYLKDMDRKLKAIVQEWRRSENKQEVMKQINALLFDQKQKQVAEKKDKKLNEKFVEIGGEIKVGVKVKMMKNRQVGIVKEIKGKNAVVQLGAIPITVNLSDLVVVLDKLQEPANQ